MGGGLVNLDTGRPVWVWVHEFTHRARAGTVDRSTCIATFRLPVRALGRVYVFGRRFDISWRPAAWGQSGRRREPQALPNERQGPFPWRLSQQIWVCLQENALGVAKIARRRSCAERLSKTRSRIGSICNLPTRQIVSVTGVLSSMRTKVLRHTRLTPTDTSASWGPLLN